MTLTLPPLPTQPPSPALTPEGLERLRRSSGLSIDAQGRWWHEGEPFINERLIALFNRGLGWRVREGEARGGEAQGGGALSGEATLTVGAQWCYVGCDRTPFLARRLIAQPAPEAGEGGGLWAELNTGARALVRAFWLEEEVLFVALEGPAPAARLSRHAQAQCAAWLEEVGEGEGEGEGDGGGAGLALRAGGRLFLVGVSPP